jgi:hypothetical protein
VRQAPGMFERIAIPTQVSGWAIAAGYLGLFSIALFGAPFAIFAGIMALRDIKANPHKLGKGRAWFGIIIGSLMILLIGASLINSAFHSRANQP